MIFFAKGDTRIAYCNTLIPEERVATSIPVSPTSKKPVQSEQLTNSQLQHSDFPYLRAAIANQIDKISALPPNKQNWHEYERLRLLARRLRKNAGMAWWVPLAFAVMFALVLLFWLAAHFGRSESYLYPQHYWRVVQNLTPCGSDGSCGDLYLIQEVNQGVANPPTIVKFRGAQHFENGQTLSWMKGRWIGAEFAVEGWDLVRQDRAPVFINGKWRVLPTLAPNCQFDWSTPEGHVICEGGKARF